MRDGAVAKARSKFLYELAKLCEKHGATFSDIGIEYLPPDELPHFLGPRNETGIRWVLDIADIAGAIFEE